MNIDKITAELALSVGAFLICISILFTIWKWATTKEPAADHITNEALVSLLTRIQVLDTDIERLNKKINVVIKQQENKDIDN